MKRIALIFVALFYALNIFACAQMAPTGWAWINDDGDLTSASFTAQDEMKSISIVFDSSAQSFQTLRLRFRIDNPAPENLSALGLLYAPLDSFYNFKGSYIDCTSSFISALGPDSYFGWKTSDYVIDGTATEERGLSFHYSDNSFYTPNWSDGIFTSSNHEILITQSHTEVEYCFSPTKHCKPGQYFFMPGGDIADFEAGGISSVWHPANLTVNDPSTLKKSSNNHILLTNLNDGLQIDGLVPETKVNIYDALGRMVETDIAKTNTLKIDNLCKGVYVLDIGGQSYKAVVR